MQTLRENEECSTTQVVSTSSFTATSCVGDQNKYIYVFDNNQPAFSNLYAAISVDYESALTLHTDYDKTFLVYLNGDQLV